MAEFSELVGALTWLLTNRIQQKIEYTHGLLGDGNGNVRVSADPDSPDVDFVFVRPDRNSNRTYKIFNKRVQGEDNDPIIIGELPWEPNLFQVVDLDWQAYKNVGWGDYAPNVTYHGKAHEWRDGAPGLDAFNVYRRQLGDLKAVSSTSGTSAIDISSYSIELFGTQKQFAGITGFPLDGAIPAGSGTARMALVYWDPASGTTGALGVSTGTLGTDTDATLLNRAVSPPGTIPIAHVRLAGGISSIAETDIFDAREPFRPGLSFSTGTAGLSADMIPISDTSGLYTGSTVESALDQIGFDGARVSKVYESDFGAVALQSDVDGDIGIGTASPAGKLEINTATASKAGLIIKTTDNDVTEELLSVQLLAGTEIFNVSAPVLGTLYRALTIDTSVVAAGARSLPVGISYDDDSTDLVANISSAAFFENKNQTANNYASLMFVSEDSGNTSLTFGHIACVFTDHTTSSLDADLAFIIRDTNVLSEKMRITSSGDVGIGTSAPQGLLDLSGGPTTSFNITATNPSLVVGKPTANNRGYIELWGTTASAYGVIQMTTSNLHLDISDGSASIIAGFYSAANIRLAEGGGNVAIGHSTPSTRLDIGAGAMEFDEMTAPGAGAANTGRIYFEDNGAGKTRMMVIFATGAAQQVAIQP
jgi:hypothetical protein